HRLVDELGLLRRVAVALVVDGHAVLLGGGLGAVLHHIPEGVTGGTMGDHRELGGGRLGAFALRRRTLLITVATGTAGQRAEQDGGDRDDLPLHHFLLTSAPAPREIAGACF